ncbi:MAG: prepilin-type N-terminal cleavage/methylation domain-containing protein [Candidatus Omnitrophota bacterium]
MKLGNKGFTLIEIVVVAGVIGLVAANLAVPAYLTHIETARKKVCIENRRVTEHAEQRYFLDIGKYSSSLQDLVDKGYIKVLSECPSGGIYAWSPYLQDDSGYHTVLACSVHGSLVERLTILGSNFSEISEGFAGLFKDYYDENGEYPGGSAKKVFQALGLDFNNWTTGIGGIKYQALKDGILKISKDKGYVFYVTDSSGKQRSPSSLLYSADDETWYYGKVNPGREVDIDTFKVVEK